jgi:hypothetical protein
VSGSVKERTEEALKSGDTKSQDIKGVVGLGVMQSRGTADNLKQRANETPDAWNARYEEVKQKATEMGEDIKQRASETEGRLSELDCEGQQYPAVHE